MPTMTYLQAISNAMREEMREDDAANKPRNAGPSNPGSSYGPPNGLR